MNEYLKRQQEQIQKNNYIQRLLDMEKPTGSMSKDFQIDEMEILALEKLIDTDIHQFLKDIDEQNKRVSITMAMGLAIREKEKYNLSDIELLHIYGFLMNQFQKLIAVRDMFDLLSNASEDDASEETPVDDCNTCHQRDECTNPLKTVLDKEACKDKKKEIDIMFQ